jgi:hypothetical protein
LTRAAGSYSTTPRIKRESKINRTAAKCCLCVDLLPHADPRIISPPLSANPLASVVAFDHIEFKSDASGRVHHFTELVYSNTDIIHVIKRK